MGRGRAKAKQQKVARELKYSTHETDFSALQRELSPRSGSGSNTDSDSDERDDDPYADDGFDDEDSWAAQPR